MGFFLRWRRDMASSASDLTAAYSLGLRIRNRGGIGQAKKTPLGSSSPVFAMSHISSSKIRPAANGNGIPWEGNGAACEIHSIPLTPHGRPGMGSRVKR